MAKDKLKSKKKSKSKRSKPDIVEKPPKKKKKKEKKTKNLISPEYREQMIAEAAYFKALKRNFKCECCLVDWREAEKEIDASLLK